DVISGYSSVERRYAEGGSELMATAEQLPNEESPRVPLEVYLHCSDWEPDAEYVDGEIEQRPIGQNDHSAWQGAIAAWFGMYGGEWNIRVRPSLRVRASETRYRIPDVTILDRDLPVEPIVTHPPVAVFEILSPEDRYARLMRKLKDYEAMGIPQIWVIDPEGPVTQRYQDGQLAAASLFDEPSRGIRFEMSAIETLID
ncbi:MAG: Uma2 family endonuclease, partial [Acidobacteriaceae bacterium]